MNYAIIRNGIVINIIYLHPSNANNFSNAIPYGDLPIMIGDMYSNGKFYRNGSEIKTEEETLANIIKIIKGEGNI